MNKNLKLVTIIVPVYNIDKYLNKCLNSILNQTYHNYEVIIVDDGSSDNSAYICDKFSKEDERFYVIHKKNEGVSVARNFAIDLAKGEYLVFLDGDDWIDVTFLETYITILIENKVDIVIGEYISEKNKNTILQPIDLPVGKISKNAAYFKVLNPKGFYGSVWGKIFLTSIIKEKNIIFDKNICIGEDLQFTIKYLNYCEQIYYSGTHMYYYRIREGSALNNINNKIDFKGLDIIKVYKQIINEAIEKNFVYKNRSIAIYTFECADWYCKLSVGCKNESKYLRNIAIKYIFIFCKDSTYSLKSKISAVLKLVIPKTINKLKYKYEE